MWNVRRIRGMTRISENVLPKRPGFVHRSRSRLWITSVPSVATLLGALEPIDLLPRPFPGGGEQQRPVIPITIPDRRMAMP